MPKGGGVRARREFTPVRERRAYVRQFAIDGVLAGLAIGPKAVVVVVPRIGVAECSIDAASTKRSTRRGAAARSKTMASVDDRGRRRDFVDFLFFFVVVSVVLVVVPSRRFGRSTTVASTRARVGGGRRRRRPRWLFEATFCTHVEWTLGSTRRRCRAWRTPGRG